jgi:transcriptional regulator with XRE-family HTH domain
MIDQRGKDFYETLGREITEIRERRGISVYDLASLVGVSSGFIFDVEGGSRKLYAHTLNLILCALDREDEKPV